MSSLRLARHVVGAFRRFRLPLGFVTSRLYPDPLLCVAYKEFYSSAVVDAEGCGIGWFAYAGDEVLFATGTRPGRWLRRIAGRTGSVRGGPLARVTISFQVLNYFHAIKVANAGKRFKGLLV